MDKGGTQQPSQGKQDGWQYKPEGGSAAPAPLESATVPGGDAVEWTASEFIAHAKNPLWYVVLGLVMLLISFGLYRITHDVISVSVVVLLGIVFGIAATRKPRIVAYQLDRGGITVGGRLHPYGLYKSFAVVDEGAFASITFLPLQRLGIPLNIYFDPQDEHEIMEVLAKHLPMQPGELGSLERVMRSLHF